MVERCIESEGGGGRRVRAACARENGASSRNADFLDVIYM